LPKLIAVVGSKHAGKTTILEHLITQLKTRGFHVGAVKEMVRIPTLDTPQTETDRYAIAGAEKIVALPRSETVIFIKKRLTLKEVQPYIEDLDFAILEGFEHEKDVPKIVAAKTFEEAQSFMDDSVVAVSGIIIESTEEKAKAVALGVPLLSSLTGADKLACLVEQKATFLKTAK
jgi:molybdopterin-guanine dinucleotide biosynthesis protein B